MDGGDLDADHGPADVPTALRTAAGVLARSRCWEDDDSLIEAHLELQQQSDPDPVGVVEHLMHLADALADSGDVADVDEAFEAARCATRTALHLLGRGHGHTSMALSVLQDAVAEIADPGEVGGERAADLLLGLLEVQVEVLGRDSPACLDTLVELGDALAEAGLTQEAIAVLRTAVAEEERIRGTDDPDTLGPLGARASLAHHLYLANEDEEAMQVYLGLSDAQRRVLGDTHKDTVETRKTILGLREEMT